MEIEYYCRTAATATPTLSDRFRRAPTLGARPSLSPRVGVPARGDASSDEKGVGTSDASDDTECEGVTPEPRGEGAGLRSSTGDMPSGVGASHIVASDRAQLKCRES